MVSVTAGNIESLMQAELDRAPLPGTRLVANLFVRRGDGGWLVRVEPERDDAAGVMEIADRLVSAEERLEEATGVTISLLPVLDDEMGLLGSEIVKVGVNHGV